MIIDFYGNLILGKLDGLTYTTHGMIRFTTVNKNIYEFEVSKEKFDEFREAYEDALVNTSEIKFTWPLVNTFSGDNYDDLPY